MGWINILSVRVCFTHTYIHIYVYDMCQSPHHSDPDVQITSPVIALNVSVLQAIYYVDGSLDHIFLNRSGWCSGD